MSDDTLETISQTLAEIIDPETGLNIMRMDLIHDLSVGEDGKVRMTFRPSSPVCPMAYSLANKIKKRLERLASIRSVDIKVENFRDGERLEQLLRS